MLLEHLVRDTRLAFRGFARRPGFTATVVITLALGIASNVAIFSVANAVLFTPLPYDDPEELALVWTQQVNSGVERALVSGPDYLDYKNETTLFEDFAGAFAIPGTMTGDGRAEQLITGWTSYNIFDVLGVRPFLGRTFNEDDEIIIDPAAFQDPTAEFPPGALVLSYSLWLNRFGGDANVVGTTVEMDNQASVIIGVLPEDFRIYLPEDAGMPTNIDAWRVLPIDYNSSPRDTEFITVVARMKEGVTPAQAQAELDGLATRLREQYQFHATSGMRIDLNPMHEDVVRHIRPVLMALLGAVAFVLLIACANVANLLLVRAAARGREIAVRAAIGGDRWTIVRQMLTESFVLAFTGGVLGLALAWAGVKLLVAMRPDNLPRVEAVALDGTVLIFTLLASAAAALLFGTAPALKASRPDLARALTERSGESGGIRGNKLRTALVVTEVALSLVLLIGAGLVVRSFDKLQDVDPGFDAPGVLTMSVPLPVFGYRVPSTRTDFYMNLLERIRAIPGVQQVGGGVPIPLGGGDQYFVFSYGKIGVPEEEWARNKADYRWITTGYLETLGIELLEGRYLEDGDNRAGSPNIVVVDEDLARRLWPDESAVGQQLQVEMFNFEGDFSMLRVPMEIVGVVEHIRTQSLMTHGREAVYFPHKTFPYVPQGIVLKATGPQDAIMAQVREAVAELDGNVPVADVRFMDEIVGDALAPTRFILTLIALFAVLALVLASVGLYGVIAYSVRQRTREIGVRMTFGAARSDIIKLIVGQGAAVAFGGIVVGLLGAFFLTRIVTSVLYGVTARDPVTFSVVPFTLAVVALGASYLPARRALKIDPTEALRDE